LALICATGFSSDESGARLLINKRILNKFYVESKDILIEYSIFNVGSSAALNVQLKDESFPEESFEVVRGLLNVKLDRLAPGNNVSHAIVVRPKHHGYMNFSAAQVRYLASEGAKEEQIGYSSIPYEGGVAPFRDYDKKFSPHILDWLAFTVMTLPSLGIPFYLWHKSKTLYTTDVAKVASKRS